MHCLQMMRSSNNKSSSKYFGKSASLPPMLQNALSHSPTVCASCTTCNVTKPLRNAAGVTEMLRALQECYGAVMERYKTLWKRYNCYEMLQSCYRTL